jgi:hypothetical protein
MRWRFGLPLTEEKERNCVLCGDARADNRGVHAQVCRVGNSRHRMHNSARDFIYSLASDGLAGGATREYIIPLQNGSERLRLDGYFSNLQSDGMGIGFDVTVVQTKMIGSDKALISTAAKQKMDKYDAVCRRAGIKFIPVVLNMHGAMNKEGMDFLRLLAVRKASRFGTERSIEIPKVTSTLISKVMRSVVSRLLITGSAGSTLGG